MTHGEPPSKNHRKQVGALFFFAFLIGYQQGFAMTEFAVMAPSYRTLAAISTGLFYTLLLDLALKLARWIR